MKCAVLRRAQRDAPACDRRRRETASGFTASLRENAAGLTRDPNTAITSTVQGGEVRVSWMREEEARGLFVVLFHWLIGY